MTGPLDPPNANTNPSPEAEPVEAGVEAERPAAVADAAPTDAGVAEAEGAPEPMSDASPEDVAATSEPAPPLSATKARETFTDRANEPLVAAPDPRLLEVLVCPVTRGLLEYDKSAQELISRTAKLAYPIRDGIPIMLPEEARELSDAEA